MIQLIPFKAHTDEIRVEAEFMTFPDGLILGFSLSDPKSLIQDGLVPGEFSAQEMRRTDGLWQTTCLEAFWGIKGQRGYWELNLSAAKPEWNLYRFDSPRLPSPPRPSADFALKSLRRTSDSLLCALKTSLKLTNLEKSLCAVIRVQSTTYYYSERHVGNQPDFHNRRSWSAV